MTTQQYNKGVATIVKTIVANNSFGVAQALRDAGYATKGFIPASELESALLQLSMTDQVKFFTVLKSVPWNNGQISTNQPQVREALYKLVNAQPGSELARSDSWWETILGLFIQQAPAPPPPQQSSNIIGTIALALVATVVGIIIYKLIMKFF